MSKLKDLTGLTYGQLRVDSYHGPHKTGQALWLCVCECGDTCIKKGWELRSGKVTSCPGVPHRTGKHSRAWTGYNNISGLFWDAIQRSAAARNHDFDISIEYASDLFDKQESKCALSGLDLIIEVPRGDRGLRTASLDRIDSTVGYCEGNVQWVHKDVNLMKNKLDQDHFIQLCKLITNERG